MCSLHQRVLIPASLCLQSISSGYTSESLAVKHRQWVFFVLTKPWWIHFCEFCDHDVSTLTRSLLNSHFVQVKPRLIDSSETRIWSTTLLKYSGETKAHWLLWKQILYIISRFINFRTQRYKVHDRLGQSSQYGNVKFFNYKVLDLKAQSFKCAISKFQILEE